MNVNVFTVKDGKIELNKYKLVVRFYDTVEKASYQDRELYLDEEGYTEWTTQLIPKHQLYELLSTEEIDDTEYSWMNGIEITGSDRVKKIEEIASYGSLEAYQASLPEYMDEFMLDMECRMAMVEMGIQ